MQRVLGTAIVTVWMVVLAGTGWADMGKTAPALKAAPGSKAEAHYDVALALDKTGDHKAATEHFKTAYDLGKNNPDIQNSGILKAHLKMK